MRTLKRIWLNLLLVVPFLGLQAQMGGSTQQYWVHEDVVKPSMVSEYESVCKELISNLKKYNIQEPNFICTNLDDSRYLYVGPMNKMADLDIPIFATLAEKMGSEAMSALFKRMDKCYDIEHDYVLTLDNDLSYMPEGITQTPQGQDYRKFHYLHVAPGNRAVVKEKVKAIKDLFASKGSKQYYRVYRSGFGTRGEFYMVAVAAKDPVDLAEMSRANDVLLGADGEKAFTELFSNILQYESFTGRMRPDLYYQPQ